MSAHPLSAALALDRIQAAALMKALAASPVILLGGGALVILATIRLTLLVDELALGGVDAVLAAAVLAAALMLALTLTMMPGDRAQEGPLGFAFVDPAFTARVAMIRAGLAVAPVLALVLVVVAWRRTDLILPAMAGLACGGIGGVVIGGALGPMRARLSGFKKVPPAGQGSRRPTPRAPVVHGLIGAAIMAVLVFRLQAQGVDKAASLAAAAGVGLAALGAVRVDSTRFALLAGLPADLSRTVLPLIPLPLLIVTAVSAGMLLMLDVTPGPALALGLIAGLAAAALRVILALSSLGRSRVGAQQAAAVEVLILILIAVSGLAVLAPPWIAIRLIWLWRRAERVRWREATS